MAKFTKKLLALLTAVTVIMTMAAVPTMAAGDYLDAERIVGSYTTYTRDQFVADFEAAENKSILNFEDGNFTTIDKFNIVEDLGYQYAIAGGSVPISGCASDVLNVLWRDYNGTGSIYGFTSLNSTAFSGEKSLIGWTGTNGAHMVFRVGDGTNLPGGGLTHTSSLSIRPTAVGFVFSTGLSTYAGSLTVNAKYTDGTTDEDVAIYSGKAGTSAMDSNANFIGIKAPTGKSISHIQIISDSGNANGLAYIDDVCVILEDPADFDANKTETVEVSGEATLEQPAYNTVTKATYTAIAKDDSEKELEPLIQWKLDGDYYGDDVSIDENGVLTVTRDFDTTKTIKLIAYVHNELTGLDVSSDPFEVTVKPVDAYLRADRYLGDVTSYSRAEFIEDFENAQHKAVLNFEDGNYNPSYPCWQASGTNLYNWYGGAIQGFNVPITNVANTELNIYWKGYNTTSAYLPLSNKFLNTATSGKNSISVWNSAPNYFVFGYENLAGNEASLVNTTQTTLRPTAVGFMFSHGDSTQYSLSDVKVKYTDGSSEDINADNIVGIVDYPSLDLNTGNNGYFMGFKAPAGKFIQHVQFHSGSGSSYVDDICVILEDPAKAELALATDYLGYTEISALSDIGTSTTITASMPKNGVDGSKLILAVYGAKGLIDVDFVDANPASGTVTAEVSRGSETVKSVKAFIWNSMTGLVPLDGAKFILQ